MELLITDEQLSLQPDLGDFVAGDLRELSPDDWRVLADAEARLASLPAANVAPSPEEQAATFADALLETPEVATPKVDAGMKREPDQEMPGAWYAWHD